MASPTSRRIRWNGKSFPKDRRGHLLEHGDIEAEQGPTTNLRDPREHRADSDGTKLNEQKARIVELERANEAKEKKIRERDLQIISLEQKYSNLKDELDNKKALSHYENQHRTPNLSVEGYTFCVDLSSGLQARRELVIEAYQHLIRPILYRFPDTPIGVIAEGERARIFRNISEIGTEVDDLIPQTTHGEDGSVFLSDTLEFVWSMFSKFRVQSPNGSFRVIFIGYDQSRLPYSKYSMERFQNAELEIHNLIVGEKSSSKIEGTLWQMANETGGKNIYYL